MRRMVTALVVLALALAGCGSDESAGADSASAAPADAAEASEPAAEASEPAAAPASEDAAAAGGDVTVEVAGSDLGDILVDGEGMVLYLFDNDTDGSSTCYDDCEANWPPLVGEATAGDGVDDGLLGTTEREDGTMQVTYADQPLYYFAGDQAAGDTNGQAVGDIWWVVGPDGAAITGDGAATDDEGDDGAAAGDDTSGGSGY